MPRVRKNTEAFPSYLVNSKKKRKGIQVAKVTECEKLNLFNQIGVHLLTLKVKESKVTF